MKYKKISKRLSHINGIGLFTDENIEKGEKVLGSSPKLDLEVTQDRFDTLSENEKLTLKHYGYKAKDNKWHLNFDDVRFLNHSDKPNITQSETNSSLLIARRGIEKGEELTQDYREFEIDFRF